MGCDADLEVGTVPTTGMSRMTVLARITEEQARESAEAMGICLQAIAPGEVFYEVDVVTVADELRSIRAFSKPQARNRSC